MTSLGKSQLTLAIEELERFELVPSYRVGALDMPLECQCCLAECREHYDIFGLQVCRECAEASRERREDAGV